MTEKKAGIFFVILLALAVSLSAFLVPEARAQTTISLEPSPFVYEVGQVVNMSLWIRNVEFLHSWQAQIYYDVSILETNSSLISEGPFLKSGGDTYFPAPYLGPGYVFLGSLLTGGPFKVDGDGIVAFVGFVVLDTGRSSLMFDTSITRLEDPDGAEIICEPANGDFYTTYPRASFYYLPSRSPPALDWIPDPSLIRDPLAGEQMTFNASQYILGINYLGSYDADGSITSYFWNFGDGNTASVANPVTTHAYSASSTYAVSLTVTDNEGKSDTSATQYVSVQPAGPVAPTASFIYTPESPLPGEDVTFDASSSTPNGGIITDYSWSFGDGNTGNGKITVHAYASPGTYEVTLNVTDSEGLWDTEIKTVQVVSERTIIQEFMVDSTPFTVSITSNSTVSNIAFNAAQRMISFNVTGAGGTAGFARVAVPLNAMWGPWTVLVDDAAPLYSEQPTNTTHTLIYLTYSHSMHTVTLISTGIVPEFQFNSILAAALILTTIASAIVGVKKVTKAKLRSRDDKN